MSRTWIHFESTGSTRVGVWVRTDKSGRFRRVGMARGAHRISLRIDGKQVTVGEVRLPDEDLQIRLK